MAATLLVLATVCFARLVADPAGLVVDGDRPSVDYANRGDPRPVGNDLVFLFLPHHESVARRITEFGHWPAWDARGFGGRPLTGNPQAGMFYPPVWLAWWLRAPAALGWLTLAHLLWGGLGVYVLVRSMGPGRWAATVAAGIYQASPYLLAHTFEGHYPHVWAACWYPWAFWAFREHRAGRARGLLFAPILALTYLTGHPQEWLLLVMALTAWALVDGFRGWRSRGPRRSAAGIAAWFWLLSLSIGMTGVDVAPQSFVRPWLRRNHDPGVDVGIPHHYHLGGLNVIQLLSPTALGGPADYFGDDNYWETVCSIGLMPLALAVVAGLRHLDRRLVRGWLVLAAASVVFACGRSGGLYSLCFATVPGVGLIRVPARSLFLANLAGAVLAGLGLEALRIRMADLVAWRRLARRFGMVALIVIGLLFALDRGRMAGRVLPQHRPTIAPRARRCAPGVRTDGPRGVARARRRAFLVRDGRPVRPGCHRMPSDRRPGPPHRHRAVRAGCAGRARVVRIRADRGSRRRSGSSVRTRSVRRSCGSARRPMWRDGGSATVRPPVRIKARDAFYGDLSASVHGIEKTNIDDAFQLDRPATAVRDALPGRVAGPADGRAADESAGEGRVAADPSGGLRSYGRRRSSSRTVSRPILPGPSRPRGHGATRGS